MIKELIYGKTIRAAKKLRKRIKSLDIFGLEPKEPVSNVYGIDLTPSQLVDYLLGFMISGSAKVTISLTNDLNKDRLWILPDSPIYLEAKDLFATEDKAPFRVYDWHLNKLFNSMPVEFRRKVIDRLSAVFDIQNGKLSHFDRPLHKVFSRNEWIDLCQIKHMDMFDFGYNNLTPNPKLNTKYLEERRLSEQYSNLKKMTSSERKKVSGDIKYTVLKRQGFKPFLPEEDLPVMHNYLITLYSAKWFNRHAESGIPQNLASYASLPLTLIGSDFTKHHGCESSIEHIYCNKRRCDHPGCGFNSNLIDNLMVISKKANIELGPFAKKPYVEKVKHMRKIKLYPDIILRERLEILLAHSEHHCGKSCSHYKAINQALKELQ